MITPGPWLKSNPRSFWINTGWEGPSALRAVGELWKAGWPLGTSMGLEGPKEALSR